MESTGILVQYPASPPRPPPSLPSRRHFPPLYLPLGSIPTPSLYSHSRSITVIPVVSSFPCSPIRVHTHLSRRHNKEYSRRGSHQPQIHRYPALHCLRDQITTFLGLHCRRPDSPSSGTPTAFAFTAVPVRCSRLTASKSDVLHVNITSSNGVNTLRLFHRQRYADASTIPTRLL